MRKSMHIKRPYRYDEYLYGSVSVSVEYDTEHMSDSEAYDEVDATIAAAAAMEREKVAGKPAPAEVKKAKAETKKAKAEVKKAEKPEPKEDPTPSGDEETASGDDIPPATVDDVRRLISEYAGIKGDVTAAAKILQSFGYKSAGKVPEDALPKVAQAFREAIENGA